MTSAVAALRNETGAVRVRAERFLDDVSPVDDAVLAEPSPQSSTSGVARVDMWSPWASGGGWLWASTSRRRRSTLARDKGAPVLERSVFDRIPGVGRWATALLLDGNLGIGADPIALLARVFTLLRPGGEVLVETLRPVNAIDPRTSGSRSAAWPARGSRGRSWGPTSFLPSLPEPTATSSGSGTRGLAGSERCVVTEPTTPAVFSSPLHDERNAAILGIALGVAFTTCFVTGLLSHLIQEPPSWFTWPSRPAGLYRVTQGLHVITGLASIPLLLAKLWVVFPKLFSWPPFTSAAHAVERLALIPLIAGGLFQLLTGVANINLWYPFPFNFRTAHYLVAWITVGALIVHVGAKWAKTRAALSTSTAAAPADVPHRADGGLDRRGFLFTVFGAAGAITLFTVGQTLSPLRRLALLAPRRPDQGPQGFPVNRTAASAGVVSAARDPGYRLRVKGRVRQPLSLSLEDLRSLPQHEATLPIACVQGWSTSQRWRGVRVRDLLDRAGAKPDAEVRVRSLQRRHAYAASDLNHWHAHDPDTLLALDVNDEPIHLEHGFPVRLIGPNRPGVMQTKWVKELVVR